MWPTVLFAAIRLWKSAFLFVGFGRGLDQRNRPLPFVPQIKMAIGIGDGAFAEFLIAPDHLARLKLLANPSFSIRIAVEMIAVKNHTAMMIHHHIVRIDLLHAEFRTRCHLK